MFRQAPNPDGKASPGASASGGEFAAQFQASLRTFWLIAMGIVRDAGLAEDVVQEAAIIGLAKWRQFRAGTNFVAWAGQIVRNVALNHARRERRHRVGSLDVAPVEGSSTNADKEGARSGGVQGDRLEFDERVARAMASVADTPRVCLLLRTLEGMEYSQIAEILGIPEGTAMSHVHRTRAFLRERLADVWKERSGAASERTD